MPKLPSFKPKEIEKILLLYGFQIKRQTGSHSVYHNSKTDKVTVVPFHNRDLAKGTVRSIIRQSGLDIDLFLRK